MTKLTKWLCAQRRLRSVWSECLLCAQWVAKDSKFLHARIWSDWADAQADLSLRWAHMPFCWFCHEAAHFMLTGLHPGCPSQREQRYRYVFCRPWFRTSFLKGSRGRGRCCGRHWTCRFNEDPWRWRAAAALSKLVLFFLRHYVCVFLVHTVISVGLARHNCEN